MKQQNIYDNKNFFEGYQSIRDNLSANNLIEIPQLFELIGDVTNLKVLDLGCGCGEHDRKLAEMGAKRIVGIDLSNNMINEAIKNNHSKKIEYKVMSMNDIDKLEEKFDLVLLDPPYALDCFEDIFNILINKNLLNENALIVYESDKNHYLKENYEGFDLKIKNYGLAYVSFLYKKS